MPKPSTKPPGPVRKTLAVLEAAASLGSEFTLKDLGVKTGLHPSTVSRIAAALTALGYLRRVSFRKFAPGLVFIGMANRVLGNFDFARVAIPLVHACHSGLGCDGALAGLTRRGLLYLYHSRVSTEPVILRQSFKYPIHSANAGLTLLAFAGASPRRVRAALARSLSSDWRSGAEGGAAQLERLEASLEAIRVRGYSFRQSRGQHSLACPLAHGGQLYAVVLVCPKGRLSEPQLVTEGLGLVNRIRLGLETREAPPSAGRA